MKNFLKKNKIPILIFIILFLWCFIELLNTDSINNLHNIDAITLFFYILAFSSLNVLQIASPVFILLPTIWYFHTELHSGFIKNQLLRMNYLKYRKKIFASSLKYIWILPTVMLFLFLGCIVITKNFDFTNAIPKVIGTMETGELIVEGTISPINTDFYNTPILLMLTFFIVLILHSTIYAIIGLIMCKNNSSKIVTIIASFLFFIILNIFSEVVLSKIFLNFLKFNFLNGIFNLFGIWVYSDYQCLLPLVIYSLILVSVLYFVLYLFYKNKEEVMMQSEK